MRNAEIYQKMLECGCADIWLPEMELLPPEIMESRKKLWSDTLKIDDMTVFAIDGYGDLYAWRPDDSVVFIETGSGECQEFAAGLPDAVFRRIAEFANGDYAEMCSDAEKAEMDPDDAGDYISEDDAVGLLRQYQNAFGFCFSQEQKEYIDTLIQRGFLPDCSAFIYEDELMHILHEWLKIVPAAGTNILKLDCRTF